MVSKTNKLYLISVKDHAVAVIPAKDALEAISKYLTRIGFANPYAYFYSYLMTNGITFNTSNPRHKQYFGAIDAATTSSNLISIFSQRVANCADSFALIHFKDINNPLFIRPTIKEVRNCDGFGDAPECELRKFCI